MSDAKAQQFDASILESIEQHLQHYTFLCAQHRLTFVDIIVFASIHATIASFNADQCSDYFNIKRWYNHCEYLLQRDAPTLGFKHLQQQDEQQHVSSIYAIGLHAMAAAQRKQSTKATVPAAAPKVDSRMAPKSTLAPGSSASTVVASSSAAATGAQAAAPAKGVTAASASATGASGKTELTEEQKQASIAKREAAKAAKAAKASSKPAAANASSQAAAPGASNSILRSAHIVTGCVKSVSAHATDARLLVLKVDLGQATQHQAIVASLSQLASDPQQLVDHLVLVLVNGTKADIKGSESNASILVATQGEKDNLKKELLQVLSKSAHTAQGQTVTVRSATELLPQPSTYESLNAKQVTKLFSKELRIDKEGHATTPDGLKLCLGDAMISAPLLRSAAVA